MIAVRCGLYLFACALLSILALSVSAAPRRLILAHAEVPGSVADITANEFARRLNSKLAGRLEIVVKGTASPDNEEALLDLVKSGKVALCLLNSSLARKMPAVMAFKLPYLVLARSHIQKVRATLLKTYLVPEAHDDGLEMLAMWDNGFRYGTGNMPSAVLAPGGEVNGLILRIAPGSFENQLIRKFGVATKEVPNDLVYEALRTKEVTAQDSSLAIIVSRRYYEVQKYLILTGHVYQPSFLVASSQHFSQMDSEEKRAIASMAKEMEDWSLNTGEAEEARMIAELRTKMIVEEPDRLTILLRMIPVYQVYTKENPRARPIVKVLYDQSVTGIALR